jgi:hypothetical protein
VLRNAIGHVRTACRTALDREGECARELSELDPTLVINIAMSGVPVMPSVAHAIASACVDAEKPRDDAPLT